MARNAKPKTASAASGAKPAKAQPKPRKTMRPGRWLTAQLLRLALVVAALLLLLVILFKAVNPPSPTPCGPKASALADP